ncbi:WbqC family protein [Legionella spiritensis]|uniref:WbqC-like protein family protein n=1 Tax=Legionella spiritensis TaxID=452 RepID=A0A0W0YYT7_LEGSP|nr:WbqC family protein [Legionella spiritensis]KTD62002.1 WbqC-like protein family protein [Legionella spiritensis]SNV34855.1 WbqC-like protein family [Legionella spiritensis]
MTICAIHQPNFFPWLGYFDKIRQADVFIFLDEVAYPKSGSGSGSWCNRVKLMNAGQPAWYGLPIQKQSGVQFIKHVYFSNKTYHLGKLKSSLQHNYRKAPYYQEVMEFVEPLLNNETDSLAEYNMHVITTLAEHLNVSTRFIRQSELVHQSHSTELLIELIKQVGADTYLCGNGADGYQNDNLFTEHNIRLRYQNYNPLQDESFKMTQDDVPGLSILHYLFHKGIGFKEQPGIAKNLSMTE